jgi:hypothetical protein
MKVHKNSQTLCKLSTKFIDNYQKFTNKILNYWFQNLPPVRSTRTLWSNSAVKVCKQKYPKVKGKNIPETRKKR